MPKPVLGFWKNRLDDPLLREEGICNQLMRPSPGGTPRRSMDSFEADNNRTNDILVQLKEVEVDSKSEYVQSHACPSFGRCVKIALIGPSGAGKTSLVRSWSQKSFEKDMESTIGADFTLMSCFENSNCDQVEFWDISGQERFRGVCFDIVKECEIVLLVFDVSRETVVYDFDEYIGEIKETPIVLVGTKGDLGMPNLMKTKIEHWTRCHGDLPFFKVSSFLKYRTEELFSFILESALNQRKLMEEHLNQPGLGSIDSGENQRGSTFFRSKVKPPWWTKLLFC